MSTSKLILDTNIYIFGLLQKEKSCERILEIVSKYQVIVPRIILQELHNNLSGNYLNRLYGVINKADAEIVDKKVPADIVSKYEKRLPFEDAVIAAYCEFLNIDFLISENRHFLVEFKPKGFAVMSSFDFLQQENFYK